METGNGYMLNVQDLSVNRMGRPALENVSFSLCPGDHLAVTGPSGSGKSTLGLALAGKLFYKGEVTFATPPALVWIAQQHHFKNLSGTTDFYYQQRFNSHDSEQTQTVEEALQEAGQAVDSLLDRLKIADLRKRPVIQLSNGENKKLQIAKALLCQPTVLVMDQPFTGLDAGTREYLHNLIDELSETGITMILITTPAEIPACITKVLLLEKGTVTSFLPRQEFLATCSSAPAAQESIGESRQASLVRLSRPAGSGGEDVIVMKQVNVRYEDKSILENINWTVKKEERWLLSGANGAGKSTLLSLVTADNPQAYANDIWLFGRKRGSGESIWDIKKQIGFVSPELHLFFDPGCTVFEVIASGLFDTIGLFRQLAASDTALVNEWMSVTRLQQLQGKRLYELPAGGQRMVLLARALVKNPPLLILDEPCQGLDTGQQRILLDMIDRVCIHGRKAMVFVTHYTAERPACIDHFMVLDKGAIAETGVLVGGAINA